MTMSDTTTDGVRAVLRDHARLPVDPEALGDDADLFVAGMSSHASVNVMLALEDRFEIEFPDHMLTREVFQTIGSMAGAVNTLSVPT
jgi:acyl carrier protein